MKNISARELLEKYCSFFENKGHKRIPSAPIVPENDPSALFTSAGMQPLVPYLLGETHPLGRRLVNVQECLRTDDIDEIGDTFHHTWFEMLGHWSLGDYFKVEAIEMTFELLTKVFKLPISRLAITVFAGNQSAERDEESALVWQKLGIAKDRIAYLNTANWWELPGDSGPCGPSTEAFYWVDDNSPAPDKFDPDDTRWVELGNDVLMAYEKAGKNKYRSASQKNIDNGTGLERTLAALNGISDDYKTSIFAPIISAVSEISGKKYGVNEFDTRSMRIIADHLRSAVFVLAGGVMPSNKEQGYVLRRLIRRSIRQGRLLGIEKKFTKNVGLAVIENQDNYGGIYPHLNKNKTIILQALDEEEVKFNRTISRGLLEIEKIISQLGGKKVLPGEKAFYVYESFGFPLEMIIEEAGKQGISVDRAGFKKAQDQHRKKSQTAAVGRFKGGLSGYSEKTIAFHTATHLLQAALRRVLGTHVVQLGSNINEDRLRFDFAHDDKLTDNQIKQVEDLVNKKIKADLPVEIKVMSFNQAKKLGALSVVGRNYPPEVKVYSIGDFSCEICGGPHVSSTGQLGEFKIIKQESCGAGKRRIYGILN